MIHNDEGAPDEKEESYTISQIRRLYSKKILKSLIINDKVSFEDDLYNHLQKIIYNLYKSGDRYCTLDENGFNSIICDSLSSADINASAETHHGGHVDILVKSSCYRYTIIIEGKKWGGAKYYLKAMWQLFNKYDPSNFSRFKVITCYFIDKDAMFYKNKMITAFTRKANNYYNCTSVITDSDSNNYLPCEFHSMHTVQNTQSKLIQFFVPILSTEYRNKLPRHK